MFLFVNGRAVSPPPHFFVSRQDGEGGGRQSLDREKKRVYLNEREAIKNVRRRLLRCFASLLFLKRKKERTRFFFLDSPSSSPFLIARVPPFFSPMVSMSSLLRHVLFQICKREERKEGNRVYIRGRKKMLSKTRKWCREQGKNNEGE